MYLRNSFLVGNTTNIGDTTLTFVDGSEITGTGVSGTTPVEYIDLIVDGQKTIQHIRHYTTNVDTRQPAISGIALNGNLIVDEANKDKTEPPVKVVSTGYPDSNTMVVDGGEWAPASNQSEVWSNSVTGASTSSNFAATKMFDGVTAGTGNRNGTLAASGDSFYEWTTTAFPDASEVTIYYTGSNGSLEVNGSNVPVTNDSNTSVTVSLTGGLTSIKSYSGSSPDTVYVMIKGVAVDGKLLIDQGVSDLGDTHVTFGPVSGTATFLGA